MCQAFSTFSQYVFSAVALFRITHIQFISFLVVFYVKLEWNEMQYTFFVLWFITEWMSVTKIDSKSSHIFNYFDPWTMWKTLDRRYLYVNTYHYIFVWVVSTHLTWILFSLAVPCWDPRRCGLMRGLRTQWFLTAWWNVLRFWCTWG